VAGSLREICLGEDASSRLISLVSSFPLQRPRRRSTSGESKSERNEPPHRLATTGYPMITTRVSNVSACWRRTRLGAGRDLSQ
jgi:hypothetical protein